MQLQINQIFNTDALTGLKNLPDNCTDFCISSPPYWALRSYLPEEHPSKKYELGQEPFFKDYIKNLLEIYKEVYRVLKPEGSCFVNLGDSYYGGNKGQGGMNSKQKTNLGSVFVDGRKFNQKEIKRKSLCNIPYRFAIGMTDDVGFIQRNQIIWHKPNVFVSSVKDRFTVDFEPMFFFTKSEKYYFKQQFEPFRSTYKNFEYNGNATKDYENQNAQNPSDAKRRILESMSKKPGRNKRTVWEIKVKPSKSEHTATFSEELITTPILACCPENGICLDPFMGVGTTAITVKKLKRNFIGFELSEEFYNAANQELAKYKIF